MPFLELTDISAGYGRNGMRTEVLRDTNLSVERGEFVAIVGYSGGGKSTLISLIAGLLAPDRGKVILNGREVSGPGPDRGIVFQNYSLLPWLSVYENIWLAIDQVFPDWTSDRKRQHAEKHIAMVNLTAAREKRPAELSGGMRQRVSVARAIRYGSGSSLAGLSRSAPLTRSLGLLSRTSFLEFGGRTRRQWC